MAHLFAAVLLFYSPGCPHKEPSCITPTEYVEVNLSPQPLTVAGQHLGTTQVPVLTTR